MWKHAAKQMKYVPGGMGDKREDWLEHQHQSGSLLRKQYRGTQSWDVRAKAMAKAYQRVTTPAMMDRINKVEKATATGPRKNYKTAEAKRKKEREANRVAALRHWESANQDKL